MRFVSQHILWPYQADSLVAVYRYNAQGQRTRKELPGKKTQVIVYHFDLNGQLLAFSLGQTPISTPVRYTLLSRSPEPWLRPAEESFTLA